MPEHDFQQRAEPACRERDRARLVDPSGSSSAQTVASASAGVPVEPRWFEEHPNLHISRLFDGTRIWADSKAA